MFNICWPIIRIFFYFICIRKKTFCQDKFASVPYHCLPLKGKGRWWVDKNGVILSLNQTLKSEGMIWISIRIIGEFYLGTCTACTCCSNHVNIYILIHTHYDMRMGCFFHANIKTSAFLSLRCTMSISIAIMQLSWGKHPKWFRHVPVISDLHTHVLRHMQALLFTSDSFDKSLLPLAYTNVIPSMPWECADSRMRVR